MTSPKRPARVVVEDKEYRCELRDGAFSRVLPLPVGTSEQDITAPYAAGILEIRVPFDQPKAEVTRIRSRPGSRLHAHRRSAAPRRPRPRTSDLGM